MLHLTRKTAHDPTGRAGTSRVVRLGAVAGALCASAALVACGGNGDSGSATAGAPSGKAAVTPSPNAAAPAAHGDLDFLGFEGDDLPKLMRPWLKQSGVKLRPTYISAESEIEAKLLGGGGRGVDLLSLTSPASPYLIDEGLLQPLDPDKLPNLRKLWPFFKDARNSSLFNNGGQLVAVPFFFGTLGLAWDASVVPRVTSWHDILDPRFKGKVALLDAPGPSLYAACTVLKCQPSKLTQADLTRIKDYLRPIFAQTKTFTSSFGDLISLLGSKEVAAVYPGFPFLAGAAQAAGNKDAKANIQLKEGAPLVLEAFAIAKGADNPDAAYAWINRVLSPKIDAGVAELQGASPAVTDAVALLSDGVRSLYPFATMREYYATSNLPVNAPRKSQQYVTDKRINQMWAQLKQESSH